MGNCLETCVHRRRPEAIENGQEERASPSQSPSEKAARSGAGDNNNENNNLLRKKTGMRIKIVLTKEELEWLLIQLDDDKQQGQGRQRSLEDVLDEIERGRRIRSTVGWKPSLESIIESPEVPAEQIITR